MTSKYVSVAVFK